MTQRSIHAGKNPVVIIRAGMDAHVEGWNDERVLATTEHKRGLQLDRRSESALGHLRARAKMGDRVLFDLKTDLLTRKKPGVRDDAIHAQAGGDVTVRVPFGSTVKVYGGRDVEVKDLRGNVSVYAGHDARVRNIHALVHASAGGGMDLDCETLASDNVKFSAGRDLRLQVRDLRNAKIIVNDLGGDWEGIIGDGGGQIRLNAGGDVTLVTDKPVKSNSPDQTLGQIEAPN